MKIIYIADDGKEFNDEFECEHYEWIVNHPHLKDVRAYDKDNNELTNIMSDYTYNYSEKIIVPTDEAAKDLRELGRYSGFYCYEDIESSGVWKWNECGCNSKFVKVE